MRKMPLYILLLVTTVFLSACRKQQDKEEVAPSTLPVEYYPDGSLKFLRELKVPDAENIVYDSLTRNFTISLPTNFSKDEINLNLSLYGGIGLLDSTESLTESTGIKFSYKGSKPLRFQLRATDGEEMTYQVYVTVAGQPRVQLPNTDIPLYSGSFALPLKIISGIGTTPSAPGQPTPGVKFIDPKSEWVMEGFYQDNQIHAYIPDVSKLMSLTSLTLEINFGDKKKAVLERVRFVRGLPRAHLQGFDNILFSKTDSITVYGGYFSPNEKYEVRFSSDFLSQPVSREMRYVDSAIVAGSLPFNIAPGSYLATFYEGNKVIGKSSVYFSEDKTHSVETIWKGQLQQALTRNTERLSFRKGDIFYAKPWPPKYSMSSTTAFNEKDLPDLRMKNGTMVMDLRPQLVVVHWAVAGLRFSVGKYSVPANLPAGIYQASLVFPDKKESKPYWSKITVR